MIIDIGFPFYSQPRNGLRFRAVYSGRNYRAKRELMRYKRDGISDGQLLQAPRLQIQHFLSGRFDVVTIPPASGLATPWAEMIAKRIADWLKVEFMIVFKPSGSGKRYYLSAKLQEYRTDLIADVWDRRVLLFDDFGETLMTMYRCLRALENSKQVGGLILCGV